MFLSSLTPIDIAQILNALAKISRSQAQTAIPEHRKVVVDLAALVPSKLSLFEDHHLALILHATRTLQAELVAIIDEVITEISHRRDMHSFSAQSIVMIASSLSTFNHRNSKSLIHLWSCLVDRAASFVETDLRPSWAYVILTSLAKSRVRLTLINDSFLDSMQTHVSREFEAGLMDEAKFSHAKKALGILKGNSLPN